MKLITTLSALLFTACTIPGLQTGSTLPPSSSSPAPAPAPAAAPRPAATPAAAPAPARAPAPDITKSDVEPIEGAARWLDQIHSGKVAPGHGTKEADILDYAMFCSQQV